MKNEMNTMSQAQLIEALREKKGAEIVTIETITIPKLKKNSLGLVKKHCKMNVMVGFDYQNCVNNQHGREQAEMDFVAAPRPWGKRVDLKTVEHKGQTYISANCLKTYDVHYTVNGRDIETHLVEPYLPKKSETRQGVDKPVVYRDFKVESIVGINFRGIQADIC